MAKYWIVDRVDHSWPHHHSELPNYLGLMMKEIDGYEDLFDDKVMLATGDENGGLWFQKSGLKPVLSATGPRACDLLMQHAGCTDVPVTPPIVGNPKYNREIKPGTFVDVYDVLYAFKVTDPCLQHLIKKALAAGQRGHKDARQDLVDIRDSAQRALDSYDLWG